MKKILILIILIAVAYVSYLAYRDNFPFLREINRVNLDKRVKNDAGSIEVPEGWDYTIESPTNTIIFNYDVKAFDNDYAHRSFGGKSSLENKSSISLILINEPQIIDLNTLINVEEKVSLGLLNVKNQTRIPKELDGRNAIIISGDQYEDYQRSAYIELGDGKFVQIYTHYIASSPKRAELDAAFNLVVDSWRLN